MRKVINRRIIIIGDLELWFSAYDRFTDESKQYMYPMSSKILVKIV